MLALQGAPFEGREVRSVFLFDGGFPRFMECRINLISDPGLSAIMFLRGCQVMQYILDYVTKLPCHTSTQDQREKVEQKEPGHDQADTYYNG